MDKAQLRHTLLEQRASLDASIRVHIDAAIDQRVTDLPEFASASLVLSYLSFGAEIETRDVIAHAWRAGKRVALPRCVPHTRQMDFFIVENLEGLQTNEWGIDEPVASQDQALTIEQMAGALIIVPGLAFDVRGYRLGYGGGFYDTFLAQLPSSATRVGLCRDEALLTEVPVEQHDLPVDIVVTQTRTVRPSLCVAQTRTVRPSPLCYD